MLSQTWLRGDDDAWKLGSCLNRNELNLSCANTNDCLTNRGGGLAIIVKDTVKCHGLDKSNKITFEFVTWVVQSRCNDKPLILVGIYHPPPSENNMDTTQTFINVVLEFYVKLGVKLKKKSCI